MEPRSTLDWAVNSTPGTIPEWFDEGGGVE
jgi:hypothetical protein